MTSHKIGEWRDGAMYIVDIPTEEERRATGRYFVKGTIRRRRFSLGKDFVETEQILFLSSSWAGAKENLLDAFDAGYQKGVEAGKAAAKEEIKRAIGI